MVGVEKSTPTNSHVKRFEMFLESRAQLISKSVVPSSDVRNQLTSETDAWISKLASDAGIESHKAAVVAVGGYGRKELCAFSDLDILLLHDQNEKVEEISKLADAIWYPIWDSNISLDHSVRDQAQVRRMATADFKVVLGLLDARVIFGDEDLLREVRTSVLSDWRSVSKRRLEELSQSAKARQQRFGELPFLLEPDLKESFGGLRESTILRAIAASWITDINHERVANAHEALLNVRDALHRVAGRATDKLTMQEQAEIAKLLNFESDDELLRNVSLASRALIYESDLAWSRVTKLTAKKSIFPTKKIAKEFREPLADGVVVQGGEVVLAKSANPATDVGLGWRVAAAASQSGLDISVATLLRLKNELNPLPNPWPKETLNSFVSLLGSGPALVKVWEAYEQFGLIELLLPIWKSMQGLPQRNALHSYTVDRHSIIAVVEAAKLTRNVSRPDLLLVGALFHDIGKPLPGDHSEVGADLMRDIGQNLGYEPKDVETLVEIVKYHLLIPEVATRRDLDEVVTIEGVKSKIHNLELLELLENLTIADSKATSEHVWSEWKANLVSQLVKRVTATFAGQNIPIRTSMFEVFPFAPSKQTQIELVQDQNQLDVYISTADRVGLVADVAGAFRVLRLEVKSAQFETNAEVAMQHWQVLPLFGDVPDEKQISTELHLAIQNPIAIQKEILRLNSSRTSRMGTAYTSLVRFVEGASLTSDVLEVRAHDEAALLYRVAQIVAMEQLAINAARIDTIGSEVVDVLYLTTQEGRPLDQVTKEELIHKITAEIAGTLTSK